MLSAWQKSALGRNSDINDSLLPGFPDPGVILEEAVTGNN